MMTTLIIFTGTVNPKDLTTTYYFEWGLTASHGNTTNSQSAGSGTSAATVSANLTGLTPGTVYHFRLVATNISGTAYGSDMTFKTQISGHGDNDGDGKTDIGVWRPGDGNWYIRNSATGIVSVQQWGLGALNDWPVPGDYDEDGKIDYGIWRPGDGNWYIRRSSDGAVTVTQWGSGAVNDVPMGRRH